MGDFATLADVTGEPAAWPGGYGGDARPRMGFFTDTSICIGCKACEVACKEWNEVPSDGFRWSGLSYDNTLGLGHSTWRHVKFVESETKIGAGGNASPFVISASSNSAQSTRHCSITGRTGGARPPRL